MSWSLDFQMYYFTTALIILAMKKINNGNEIFFEFVS